MSLQPHTCNAYPSSASSPAPLRVPRARRAAFTIMELIVSIAIIAMLLGIVVLAGIKHGLFEGRTVVDRTMVDQVATGLTKFKEQVGFLPPLVKDRIPAPAFPANCIKVVAGRYVVNVYEPDSRTDADFTALNTYVAPSNMANNPFEGEIRYSEVSLPYYLVGALDQDYANAGPPGLTIDGVKGPGMYKPDRDGKFSVPKEVVGDPTKHIGTPLQPFINMGSGGAKLAYSSAAAVADVKLVDRNGVPVRYYRWINGNEFPANSGKWVVNSLADLKTPRMVGRITVDPAAPFPGLETTFPTPADRDLRQSPKLRNATWAIIAAGPNGVFGDETLAELSLKLGRSIDPAQEAKFRAQAENDNVIRVGNDN